METFVIGLVIVLVLLVLFGLGAPAAPASAPQPAPPVVDMILAERSTLIMRADAELQAVELRLRTSGAAQAAEGAALTRARVIEFLKGYK